MVKRELRTESRRGVVGVDVGTIAGLGGGGDAEVSGAWGGAGLGEEGG